MAAQRSLDYAIPSTRANSLLTDIAGLFLVDHDPWLPTAAFVVLYDDLGIPDATARSSLHRMTKAGFIVNAKVESTPGYAMSPEWIALMGSARLEAPVEDSGSADWILLTSTVPDSRRDERHVLRGILTRAGFAPFGNGVWIAPAASSAQARARHLLEQAGFSQHVDFFHARYDTESDPSALAKRLWDIDEIHGAYKSFLQECDTRLGRRSTTPQEAFTDIIIVSNAWRALQQRDPSLPAAALPTSWPRPEAQSKQQSIIDRRVQPATEYVASVKESKLRR